MTNNLGRREDAGTWISTTPVVSLIVLALAVLTFGGVQAYRYRLVWTASQRASIKPYIRSSIKAAVNLSPETRDDAARDVEALRVVVFGGRSVRSIFLEPAIAAGVVFVVGLLFAVPIDRKRALGRRHGRRLKGAQSVSVAEFNAAVQGDGLGLTQMDGSVLRIPRRAEASHKVMTGDTRSGKTTNIKMDLCQIRDRGEAAIVVDPKCEFLPLFFNAERVEPTRSTLSVLEARRRSIDRRGSGNARGRVIP